MSRQRRTLLDDMILLDGGWVLEVREWKRNHFRLQILDHKNEPVGHVIEAKGYFWRLPRARKGVVDRIREAIAYAVGCEVDEVETLGSFRSQMDFGVKLDESLHNSLHQVPGTNSDRRASSSEEVKIVKRGGVIGENKASGPLLQLPSGVLDSSSPYLFRKGSTFLEGVTSFTIFTRNVVEPNEQGSPSVRRRVLLVNSDREIFDLEEDIERLAARGIVLTGIPDMDLVRWSTVSIRRFLGNDLDPASYSDMPGRLEAFYRKYIEFAEGDEVYRLIAYWVIGTYFHQVFNAFPYLFLNGVKAAGKTKTLEVTQHVAYTPALSVGISPSALFRLIDSVNPTVMIDESETLKDRERQQSLREILLSGYKRGANTYRAEERMVDGMKRFSVRDYDVYCPKMIANISGLEDVLESRCISVNMRPALNQEVSNAEPDPDDWEIQRIRDRLYEALMVMVPIVKREYDTLENDGFFRNREWELWRPILALAKAFGEENYDGLLELAKRKVEESRADNVAEATDHVLVTTLATKVSEDDWVYLKDIRLWLAEALGHDVFRLPNDFTPQFVSKLVARIGFRKKRRVGGGVQFLIRREAIREALRRLNAAGDESVEEKQEWIVTSSAQPARIAVLERAYCERYGSGETDVRTADEFMDLVKALRQRGRLVADDEADTILAAQPAGGGDRNTEMPVSPADLESGPDTTPAERLVTSGEPAQRRLAPPGRQEIRSAIFEKLGASDMPENELLDGLGQRDLAQEVLAQLKQQGELFEPRPGYVRRT